MQSQIINLEVAFEAKHAVAWPHYAGSTLRGAFGRALRQAACITGASQCDGCSLRNSCTYGAVFDPMAPAHSLHPSFNDGIPRYIVQPPSIGASQLQPGHLMKFRLMLLPGSFPHLSFIEHVLRSVIETHLIAPGTFKHLGCQKLDALDLVEPQQPNANSEKNSQLTLRFQTPLRLQRQGKPLFKPQDLDSKTLAGALFRRQLQWAQLLSSPSALWPTSNQRVVMEAAERCTLDTRNLHWHDLQRQSSTQQTKLPMGGLMGAVHLSGPSSALQALHPLLNLCEHIHVGKETVMGLGRYQLSPANRG